MFGKKSAKKGITFRFLSTVRGRTAKHRELEGGGRHPDRAADTKRHQTEIRVQVFHDGGGGGGTKG